MEGRLIYFKKLVHMMRRLGKFKVCRVGHKAGNPRFPELHMESEGRLLAEPPCLQDQSFSIKPSTGWMRPIHTLEGNLLYSKSTDFKGFSGSSDGKESACNVGDPGLIPGSGRSPGEGNGNPLQYSCLENPMNGGVWQATVHGVAKIHTPLNDFTFFH